MFNKVEVFGEVPLARFGHTVTQGKLHQNERTIGNRVSVSLSQDGVRLEDSGGGKGTAEGRVRRKYGQSQIILRKRNERAPVQLHGRGKQGIRLSSVCCCCQLSELMPSNFDEKMPLDYD